MTDQKDRFFCFFCQIHKYLRHRSNLTDAPWTSVDTLGRKHRDRIDNNNGSTFSLDRRDDVIEIRIRQKRDFLIFHPETFCSRCDLSEMLLTRDVEYFSSRMCIPLTHLESKGRFPDSRLSRKEDQTSWRDSSAENTIEFTTRAR